MKNKTSIINLSTRINQINNQSLISKKVDVNRLLSKIRHNEKKKKTESIIFFSLLGSVVISLGIISTF